jgi:hypothetical protein
VWGFVHAEKFSFKKSLVAGERHRPDVARRRAQWTIRSARAPAVLIAKILTRPEPDRTGLAKLNIYSARQPHEPSMLCAAIGELLDAFTPEECAHNLKTQANAITLSKDTESDRTLP